MKKITMQFDNNTSAETSKSSEEEIAKLKEENKNLQNTLAEKDVEIQTLKFKAEQLELQLQKALLQLYGSKADKAKNNDEPSTFDEPELTPDTSADELDEADEEITIPEHKRKKPKRKSLPEHLPRKEVIHDLSEEEKICKCGEPLTHIGDEGSEQLEYTPAQVTVIVNKRKKYACKNCEETIKLAPLPKMPIPKSIATAIQPDIIKGTC
jgi:transposase